MDTSPFVEIGQQLQDFLTKQFSPPPSTKCELGFLGSGIAVEPESFLSQGQFNPARINTWLNIVADPIHTISDGRVTPTQLTATQLMQAICSLATSAAPAENDTATNFAKLKSQAMENLGGIVGLSAVPLNWYDPAQLPKWSNYSLTTGTTSADHEDTGESPPPPRHLPPRHPLWSWRRLPQVLLEESPVTRSSVSNPSSIESLHQLDLSHLHLLEDTAALKPSIASSIAAVETTATSRSSFNVTDLSQLTAANEIRVLGIEPVPNISITESVNSSMVAARTELAFRSISVSSAISQAADQAVTSAVASSSLSINLSYLFVELSRVPWWNELLIMLNNWYVPGQQRATFVADATASQSIGIPIALVLTNNVQIQGTWSQSDLNAVSSNTHIGPWTLSGYQMTTTGSSGQATLSLPGMQAIACIYRLLPPLPPIDDPNLIAQA